MPREPIPSELKRRLRKDAGFGCCFCGNPIVEYHHIREYSEAVQAGDPPHVESDMMVVCPTCHALCTNGTYDEPYQRRAKARAFNPHRGFVGGRLHLGGAVLRLRAGNARIDEWFAFAVDDELVFALTKGPEGNVEVTLRLYDEEGRHGLVIIRNEWVVGALAFADVEFHGRTLRVRRRDARNTLALDVDASRAPSREVVVRGDLGTRGGYLKMTSNTLSFGSRTTRLNNVGGAAGIGIRVRSASQEVSLEDDPARILRFE